MIRSLLTIVLLGLGLNSNAHGPIKPEKIGIVSGAGPMAGCKLYEKIIKICQKKYNCKDDKDFPEIVIISYPFSDMLTVSDRTINGKKLHNELQQCFDRFSSGNIQISAIACNTLHTLLPDGIKPTLRFAHIAENTYAFAKENKLKKLLILGTQTTLGLNLYSYSSIESIIPSFADQVTINNIINNILEGNTLLSDAQQLREIIASYAKSHDIDGVILGCTELPLLHEAHSLEVLCDQTKKIHVLDTLEILANELVKRSFKVSTN